MPVDPKFTTGLVFDIQRYSLQDGPGLRVLVFLKSCPLRCLWCSNPESQSDQRELLLETQRCIACGHCAHVCPTGAIEPMEGSYACYDRERCNLCGHCVEECPQRARRLMGKMISVEEVMAEVERDLPFFRRSGGGVTLGGGEPTSQPAFAYALLAACREQYIQTAVETCGYCGWRTLEKLASVTDLFLYDVKLLDAERHRRFTGSDNGLILNNLKRLAEIHRWVIVRYPLIPGYNDRAEDIDRLIRLFKNVKGLGPLELEPYHRYGETKYDMLCRPYPLKDVKVHTEEAVARVCEMIRSRGIDCRVLH